LNESLQKRRGNKTRSKQGKGDTTLRKTGDRKKGAGDRERDERVTRPQRCGRWGAHTRSWKTVFELTASVWGQKQKNGQDPPKRKG